MFHLLLFLIMAPAFASGVSVEFDPRTPQVGPFPTDFLTQPDATQRTGRRIQLPMADCRTRPSDCGEITLINQLDGFNPNGRVTVKFSGAINPDTIRTGIKIRWLAQSVSDRPPLHPIGHLTGLNQIVYDPATHTAYGKPDEILEGSREYLLVVTDELKDLAGAPVTASPGYSACLAGEVGGGYCVRLAEATRAASSVGRIVSSSLFTTLSTTEWYDRASAVVDAAPADFERQGEIVDASTIRSVVVRRQVSVAGDVEDVPVPVTPEFVAQFGVGKVAFGSFRSPRFFLTPEQGPVPDERIYFHVWLPRTPAPMGGYPVVLAGHGFGDSRFGMPTAAAVATNAGFAVVAMSAVGHGYGPGSKLLLELADGSVREIAAPGRGVDLNGDGVISESEGCIVIVPGAPLGARDCIRQTTADYLQLMHAIRDGVDLDGDGSPDLNPLAITYLGQSLGSFYGTAVTAMSADVRAAVLNTGGGSLVETARLSPGYRRALLFPALAMRTPSLMNMGLDFEEDLPLRNEKVRIRRIGGAAEIQDFLERVEWIESPAAPQSIAPHLKLSPLPGTTYKRVMFQIALGDRRVTNPASSSLIRAAGLRELTSVYRADRARAAAPALPADPHEFLIPLGSIHARVVGLTALQQAILFLGSPVEEVPDVNESVRLLFGQSLFETPAELPEELNFLADTPQ